MVAGTLNRRVTFQVESHVADGAGGNVLSWTDYTTVWGKLTPANGREQLREGHLLSSVPAILTVRSSATTRAITTEYRVVIGGEQYQIRWAVNRDQRNRFIDFGVEVGVGT